MVSLPSSLTDKLDAVNILLQLIGEAPVNSLSSSEDVDVAAALLAIDEFDLHTQSHGWHWNREEDVTLTPNNAGNIVMPTNCLSISKAYWSIGGVRSGTPLKVVERGRKLYNKSDKTLQFSEPVQVDMIIRLEWEEMPEYARRYITLAAGKHFQGRLQTNSGVDRVTDEALTSALAILHHRDDEGEENNALTGNPEVIYRLHGRVRRRF